MRTLPRRLALLAAAAALALAAPACGPTGMSGPTMSGRLEEPPPSSPVVSTEILSREPRANHTRVKHILIGWADLADTYHGSVDPRAAKRSKHDAEEVIRNLRKQLDAGADFDTLMKAYSEDPGSAASAEAYDVSPDAKLVIEFRQLGLRLEVGEIGVVESPYGFHLMKRIE
ncbi:MAG TPA: peptidylprolyl isomerase [Kofleriaceae bacterium]|nr:peptidylprolyl isomerase [Kofleriaceae bacterium]